MNEGFSRRDFVLGAIAGAAGGAGILGASSPEQPTRRRPLPPPPPGTLEYVHPYRRLARVSNRDRQIWTVSYLRPERKSAPDVSHVLRDVDASLAGGADAVVVINEYGEPLDELDRALGSIRLRFPKVPLGVNYLGDGAEPYGWRESFRLAKQHGLEIVWTDFSGVDLIKERPRLDLHDVKSAQPEGVFYVSGAHMKYSTLLDPKKTVEESALQALGWVDGVVLTGPKTGVASDAHRVRRVRGVIGSYPLGLASGVTAQNIVDFRDAIDFVLVHTGIQVEHRIDAPKLRELRAAFDVRDQTA